jgi:Cu/Ag efflux protein CusF
MVITGKLGIKGGPLLQLFATAENFKRRLVLVFALSLCAFVCSCSHSNANQKVTGPAAAVQTTTYHGLGVVKHLNPKLPSIELDHDEIKGLMPAMTMEFYVKDKAMLDGINPGDRVAFAIENGVGGVKITMLTKL